LDQFSSGMVVLLTLDKPTLPEILCDLKKVENVISTTEEWILECVNSWKITVPPVIKIGSGCHKMSLEHKSALKICVSSLFEEGKRSLILQVLTDNRLAIAFSREDADVEIVPTFVDELHSIMISWECFGQWLRGIHVANVCPSTHRLLTFEDRDKLRNKLAGQCFILFCQPLSINFLKDIIEASGGE